MITKDGEIHIHLCVKFDESQATPDCVIDAVRDILDAHFSDGPLRLHECDEMTDYDKTNTTTTTECTTSDQTKVGDDVNEW